MKTKHLKRYLIGIVATAFLGLLVGNAFGDAALNDNPSRDHSILTAGKEAGTNWANNYMVVSPYWQVQGGNSYTFVAVSHSSLSGMASNIGVVINAITSAGDAYATAATFTVAAGATQRVFIVPTNHSTINPTTVPTATFMAGTTDFSYGHIRVNPATSHPQMKIQHEHLPVTNTGDGFRDTTMLTYWGSVIVEANTTGFAMEFIGDMNDSQSTNWGAFSHFSSDYQMGSGVNLN